jgi:hypothetical protein
MILDMYSTLEPKGTTLVGLTGAQASAQAIDLAGPVIGGSQGRDMGAAGMGLPLTVALNGITASGTATTLQLDFQGAPDNGSGAPGTWTTYVSTGPMTVAEIEALTGEAYAFGINVPARPPGVPLPRFYQLLKTVAGGTLTAGTIFAGLTTGRDDQVAYMSGFVPPPTSGAG